LLEEDEFTRLIEADTYHESVSSLTDTPYGKWMEGAPSQAEALKAFNRELKELHEWIMDSAADERVIEFISAPYDALNAGSAILKYREGAEEPGRLSELGQVTANEWQSVIWNDMGWESLPRIWQDTIRVLKKEKSATVILEKTGQALRKQMDKLAFTPLMKEIADLRKSRLESDKHLRPWPGKTKASAYEMEGDEKILAILRKYRHEPIGFDAVMAYWYAKEMEVKQLRLLLSIKRAGLSKPVLRELKRSRFLETI